MRAIDTWHLGLDKVICCWEVDGVLVDPGPESTLETVLAALDGEAPRAVLLTHIHFDHAGASGALASLRNRVAGVWHLAAIFLITALWLVWAVELRNGYSRLLIFAVVTGAVLVLARLVAIISLGSLDRALNVGPERSARDPGLEGRIAVYYPVLRALLAGETGPYRDIVLLNAAAAFLVAEKVETLREGVAMAAASIDSGRALASLNTLVAITSA